MNVKDTLNDLIRINSVSAESNEEIVDYLTRVLKSLGMEVRHQAYEGDDGLVKLNLIAIAGPNTGVPGEGGLALVGHTDTVPFDPKWAGALVPVEEDGKIFGRGACDTKAFIAAACTAASRTDLDSLTKPLLLVFTYDEEVGCLGAKHLAAEGLIAPRFAIVGEPTSLTPIYANKGYCLARITIHGKEGHSAYPDVGVNAILRAGRLLGEIEKVIAELKTKTNDDFDPPYSTLNVGVIQGGKAKNVIAGRCEISLEWRPLPDTDPHEVYERIASAAEAVYRADPTFEIEMEEIRVGKGAHTPTNSEVVAYLSEESGNAPSTVSFGTEAPEMIQLGAEAVVFGPGSIQVAHRTGEFVPVDELERCADILTGAIARFSRS